MTHRAALSARGFTLIEVMIALAIFAVVATISYATLSQAAQASRSISDEMQALQTLQRALQTIANDFAQVQPRPVREPVGSAERAELLADSRNTYLVELTRGGYANPLGMQRASAQRVAYRFEDGELRRVQWPALDNPLSNEPVEFVLFEDIERVEFRYLPAGSDNWGTQWPQPGASPAPPRAIEVFIEHARWGEISRLVEIAG